MASTGSTGGTIGRKSHMAPQGVGNPMGLERPPSAAGISRHSRESSNEEPRPLSRQDGTLGKKTIVQPPDYSQAGHRPDSKVYEARLEPEMDDDDEGGFDDPWTVAAAPRGGQRAPAGLDDEKDFFRH